MLEITRAINKNEKTAALIQMLEVIMQNSLQAGKFRLLIQKDNGYVCISKYGGDIEQASVLHKACQTLSKVKAPASLDGNTILFCSNTIILYLFTARTLPLPMF